VAPQPLNTHQAYARTQHPQALLPSNAPYLPHTHFKPHPWLGPFIQPAPPRPPHPSPPGCPLPCINRILTRGLASFQGLATLELNECSFRGNTWAQVVRALGGHPAMAQLRLVQSGVLPKYKNFHKVSGCGWAGGWAGVGGRVWVGGWGGGWM
jgi:hypothetical protein